MKTKLCLLLIIGLIIGLAGTSCEGPMGPQGPRGEQGPPGVVGPAGSDGSIIHAGQGAPNENSGKPGDFYLDLTAGNLFGPKMAEGWGVPVNLIGNEGPEGPQGPQGPEGLEGPQGPSGEDGEDGSDGQDGQDGEDGKDGQDGQDGEDGKDGSHIYADDGAPDGSLGKKGDYYLDKTSYDLYGPKTDSGWGSPVNLQGPKGDQGPQGPPGTANVIYSGWVTSDSLLPNEAVNINGNNLRILHLPAPELTQEIINSGVVLVYMRAFNRTWQLPYTLDSAGILNTFDYFFEFPGDIVLTRFTFDNSGSIDFPVGLEFRYVLIPGGLPAKMPAAFWEDYEAVAEHFGIPD